MQTPHAEAVRPANTPPRCLQVARPTSGRSSKAPPLCVGLRGSNAQSGDTFVEGMVYKGHSPHSLRTSKMVGTRMFGGPSNYLWSCSTAAVHFHVGHWDMLRFMIRSATSWNGLIIPNRHSTNFRTPNTRAWLFHGFPSRRSRCPSIISFVPRWIT